LHKTDVAPSRIRYLFAMRILFLLVIANLMHMMAAAQMAEYYAGHKRTGVDLLWFKNFKNKKEQRAAFLFFSRNRASVDYEKSPTAFGSTNAVSYNFRNGLGIVAVASFLNAGVTPKGGVQYYKAKGSFMLFGWLVYDLKPEGNIDLFGLFRYQPKINENWKGFGQLELFPVYNPSSEVWNLTQRLRLGAKYQAWAGGLMMDFNQTGKTQFTKTNNIGAFVRYDF